MITDALRQALAHRRRTARTPRVRLTTFGSGGLQAGVDLDATAALLDVMDAAGDPPRR